MSKETLSELIEHAATLTQNEKLRLAAYLTEQAAQATPSASPDTRGTGTNGDAESQRHRQHMAWLKAHRVEYADRYVALDGDRLVGQGVTVREAAAAAKQQGVDKPFVVYVFAADTLPFAGASD